KGFNYQKYGLNKAKKKGAGYFKLKRGLTPAEFLLDMVPSLNSDGYPVYGELRLNHFRVNQSIPTTGV
ncbi:MAG: hypothetical protein AAF404_09090, partial [Pseudomonadota bacterium]